MLHIYKSGPEKLHGLTVLNLELGRYKLWTKFQIFNSLNHWAIGNIGGPLSKQSNSALLLVPSFLLKLQDLVSYFSIGI